MFLSLLISRIIKNIFTSHKNASLLLRFTDIQQMAIMGMNIIPSIITEKMRGMTVNATVDKFNFFKDDLPHRGSFIAEHLQWEVSSYDLFCNSLVNKN